MIDPIDESFLAGFIARHKGAGFGTAALDGQFIEALARVRAWSVVEYERHRARLKAAGARHHELRMVDTATGGRSRVIRKELRRAVA